MKQVLTTRPRKTEKAQTQLTIPLKLKEDLAITHASLGST